MGGLVFNSRQLFKNTRNKIERGIESLEKRIRENVDIAKYVIPSALMTAFSSTTYGRIGYYGSRAFIYNQISKGKIEGKWDSKTPLIVGAISGAIGTVMGILAADIYNLTHQNHDLYSIIQHDKEIINNDNVIIQQQNQQLEQDHLIISSLEDKLNNATQTIDIYQKTLNNYSNIIHQLQEQLKQYNITISELRNENQNLQEQLNRDNITISSLKDKLNNATQTINILQSQLQPLQNMKTLEGILYGKGNSYDISIVKIDSVKIDNGTAHIEGTIYPSGYEIKLEIPESYMENNGVTIQDIFNAAQQNNWYSYIVIDRGDLQYLKLLNNQSNIPVIAIHPNEPVNIGVIATPADPFKTYYVLNHLTNYNMVIQDSIPVDNSSLKLWGYTSGSSVVINFSNNYQYNLAENMINIADQIINSPNNPNPTSEGAIYTYSIFEGTINTYQNYPQYNVGQTYIPLIVLESKKGNTIINTVYP
jgi:archaellum component FlaC